MDIYCPVCGEPWDQDELHDVPGKDYARASAEFRRAGCSVFETSHNEELREASSDALRARVVYELLGDDLDGAASIMEDFS